MKPQRNHGDSIKTKKYYATEDTEKNSVHSEDFMELFLYKNSSVFSVVNFYNMFRGIGKK